MLVFKSHFNNANWKEAEGYVEEEKNEGNLTNKREM